VKIKTLTLKNFTRHGLTEIQLPDRGLVLVSGKNGRGKSSLLEATAYAGWKRGLRDLRWDPWTEGRTGSVEVVSDKVSIARKATKTGTISTTWSLPGEQPTKWETATKSQQALEQVIGDFEVWVRACVFSKAYAQKAAQFGAATDGDRKALLETILGLDYFDIGLKRCRADLAKLRVDKGLHEQDLRNNVTKLEEKQARLRDTEQDLSAHVAVSEPVLTPLPQVPPYVPLPLTTGTAEELRLTTQIKLVDEQIASEEARVTEYRAEIERLAVQGVELQTNARHLREKHLRLGAGKCGECDQPVAPATLADLERAVLSAQENATAVQTAAATARARTQDRLDEALMNSKDLRVRRAQLSTEKTTYVEGLKAAARLAESTQTAARAAAQQQRDAVDAANKQALSEWTKAASLKEVLDSRHRTVSAELRVVQQQIDVLNAKVAAVATSIATKEAVEFALSPKGFRAHILARTLDGLTGCANAALAALQYGSMQVELRPYGTKADGDAKDAIDLKVTGVGHTYGYKGCSDGEQRRLDIAFLLALMEVSTGALNTADSTLWLDEVFDALDADGVQAVCALIDRLSKTRTVVLIAHSPLLIAALQPAMVLHVESDPQNPEVSRVLRSTRPVPV